MKSAVIWIFVLLTGYYAYLAVAGTSDVIITWTPPEHRTDETLLGLEEIDGYIIYYGKNKGLYTESISVPAGNSYTLEGVADGQYYLVMTTVDKDGRESTHSNEVHITVIGDPLQPLNPTTYTIRIV